MAPYREEEFVSLIALVFATALAGQDVAVPRECRDDNGVDRCDEENRAEALIRLGMASLEVEKAEGVEVYRTLQVDGYGRLMPSVAYERRPGQAPQVVIYGTDGDRLAAPVSADEWRRVQDMARFADREVAPAPRSDAAEDEVFICLHAWVSTVEIANAAERGVPEGPTRRRTESACDGALTTRFAFDIPALAIKHFPECDVLNPEDHRNDMTRLAQCLHFEGDRLAAAEVMNQIGWLLTPDGHEDTELEWARQLRPTARTRLIWAGESIGDGANVSTVSRDLARRQAEDPSLRAYISSFNAPSSTRVETTGSMERDGPEDSRLSAPFTQVWVWDPNGLSWTLESWTIQPFAPLR